MAGSTDGTKGEGIKLKKIKSSTIVKKNTKSC